MEKGIFATVEHRTLMSLKNSGAVDVNELELLLLTTFLDLRHKIIDAREERAESRGFITRLLSLGDIRQEVKIMFETPDDLVFHLKAIDVPSELCPITEEDKQLLLFADRAYKSAVEVRKVLDMFRRHHEVIVDEERSEIIDWVMTNAPRIRELLEAK